ncbi:MAG: helix-turn-helix transcriptional regulator [Clostridia bacterium]|nr:helix-turn-helix transcriptional regulator [Clostridia bacterium]
MDKNDVVKLSRKYLHEKNIWCTRKHGDTSYNPHWHDYYEIIFYRYCDGVCVLNGEEYSLGGESLFFMTPKDVHAIYANKTEKSYSIVISFSPDIIDKRLIEKASSSPRVMHNLTATLKELVNRLEVVYSSKRKQSHSRLMIEFMLNAILVEVLEKGLAVESEQHNLNPSIEKAILYIMTDVSRDITLEEIAEFCHLSPPYFSTLFHKETGKTLRRYINEARIEKAKHLLAETDKSVLEVSMQCGYNTVTHFIKIFKSIKNVTPSEYRETHKIT